MKKNHPYKEYEGTVSWNALDAAIQTLIDNGDLKENTAREYVVGFLCQAIEEATK